MHTGSPWVRLAAKFEILKFNLTTQKLILKTDFQDVRSYYLTSSMLFNQGTLFLTMEIIYLFSKRVFGLCLNGDMLYGSSLSVTFYSNKDP